MFRARSLARPVVASALLFLLGSAGAMTLVTGSYSRSGLGAEFSTPYDTFSISGATETIAASSTPIDIAIADYSFEVGPNCYSCNLTPSFDALLDISVDGHAAQLDLPFTWSSSGPTDFLSFASSSPLLLNLGAEGTFRLVLDNVGVLSSDGGFVRGQLTANVATTTPVPEPTAMALFCAGLGFVGYVARRRRFGAR